MWLYILFGADFANPILFLINIQIGLCIRLYEVLDKNNVWSLYSILGISTLLFKYTNWLTDAFFHKIALYILAISFMIIASLHSFPPFSDIQTLRCLMTSFPRLAYTGSLDFLITILRQVLFLLFLWFEFSTRSSDFLLFISISFSL